MSSVTGRIKEIKQPRGGFIRPSEFEAIRLSDENILNEAENVHGSVIGMVVDYLTRFNMGTDVNEAFKISLHGAVLAEKLGVEKAVNVSRKLAKNIKGLDDKSIINACKLVTFDVWYRNPLNALRAKKYDSINPDNETIQNIKILINRSISFLNEYGPITSDGFTFEPLKNDRS